MIPSTVNVAVRIRPLVPYELENGSETCVAVVQGKEKIQVEGSEKSYRFDHVFGPDVNNESFYNSVIRNKVAEVFNDRDVTIFAYGQRRSGKTHTMGTNYIDEDHMGIIPRAINTLFNIINSNGTQKYSVTVTFTELYKKDLYDLLAPNKEATERIVKMKKNGSTIVDLTESHVTNVEAAMQCLAEGSQKRVTSEKRENSQSTRSHAIFTIIIYQRRHVDPRITTMSKLHLVDLAGSMHDKKNGKKAKVNKDLLAIRNWINYEQKRESDSYSKYQSSKLAILLRDSLQGNSTVLIIACVSPASYCLDETLQTLRYANRLRKIKKDFSAKQTNPVVNKIETKMDTKLIEAKQNLGNGLDVQQSTSTIDVQESDESKTNDNMKAGWILDAQDSNISSRFEQLDWFQRELDIDTEDPKTMLAARNSSKPIDITYETSEDEVDDDWEASLIRNALKSNEASTINQETFQRESVDDIEAKRILDAQDSSKHSKTKQEAFQAKMDEDSETESIQNERTSSESSEIEQDEFRKQLDDDTEVQRNSDILESSKSIKITHKTFHGKMDVDSETESFQNAQKLNKSSKTVQERLRWVSDDDNAVQGFSDVLESSKSSTSELEMGESEADENTKAECIREALEFDTSGKYCKEIFQTQMDNTTDADRIQNILESSKSSNTGQDSTQSGTDDDMDSQSIKKALESSKSCQSEQEMTQSKINVDTKAQRTQDALGVKKSDKSEQEMIQSKTNDNTEAKSIQDSLASNKISKSAMKTFQTKMDEETDAESLQNALESNEYPKTKQVGVQIEMNDKTSPETIRNILESAKSRKNEYRIDPSETEINTEMIEDALEPSKCEKTEQHMCQTKVDDARKAETFQPAPKFSKFNEAQRENILTETVEDSPTNLFSKIADFFLEPSPDEKKELRKEIRNLRKKLRDRTAKLKTNIMDDLSSRENVGLSTTRRENAKLVVAKILEEFQEVLAYIVENSEIRDWIVRVFRRIRDLLEEQKKITGKLLNCEILDDEAMDEKHAEHTMRQVDRYHELQGVNRCIALLEELVASLPKEAITIGDILRSLEDTTNQIKKLEIEKVDLVEVLKSAEPLNESRTLAEYGIDKVLEMDEKISRLWRRRIKQMIAIERREKFDQQIAHMLTQIDRLKTARVRLVEEMKDAEKRWNLTITSGEKKKRSNIERTKKAKYSRVLPKCECKVLGCMSRRCSCVKSGMSCINCNCNAELCQNSDKENNPSNVHDDSQTFAKLPGNDDWKCGCNTDCLNRRCTCGKNGVFCNDNCRCRPEFCKNKNKENGTTEANFDKLQAPSTSTDGKMEVDRAVSSLHVNSCVCRENGSTCTNCNRSFKLREYKAKARRRLFADIDNENEGYEGSRKRPRLGA